MFSNLAEQFGFQVNFHQTALLILHNSLRLDDTLYENFYAMGIDRNYIRRLATHDHKDLLDKLVSNTLKGVCLWLKSNKIETIIIVDDGGVLTKAIQEKLYKDYLELTNYKLCIIEPNEGGIKSTIKQFVVKEDEYSLSMPLIMLGASYAQKRFGNKQEGDSVIECSPILKDCLLGSIVQAHLLAAKPIKTAIKPEYHLYQLGAIFQQMAVRACVEAMPEALEQYLLSQIDEFNEYQTVTGCSGYELREEDEVTKEICREDFFGHDIFSDSSEKINRLLKNFDEIAEKRIEKPLLNKISDKLDRSIFIFDEENKVLVAESRLVVTGEPICFRKKEDHYFEIDLNTLSKTDQGVLLAYVSREPLREKAKSYEAIWFEKIALHERQIAGEGVEGKSWHLPSPTCYFAGRMDKLRHLKKVFQEHERGDAIQIISGMGGVGKTTLASRYAQDNLISGYYEFVLCVQSYSAGCVSSEFRSFAGDLGYPQKELNRMSVQKIVNRVYLQLTKNYKRVLVIFDNVRELKDLEGNGAEDQANFMPTNIYKGQIHWLITARNKILSSNIEPIKLDEFTKDESRDYVQQRLRIVNREEVVESIDELTKVLGYFPLALSQAVSYIAKKQCAIEEYLALYRKTHEERRRLLKYKKDRDEEDLPYVLVVYTTWYISIEEIKKKMPMSEEILNMCAFYDSYYIPVDLIGSGFNNNSEEEVNEAIKRLESYSLVNFSAGGKESRNKADVKEKREKVGLAKEDQFPIISIHHLLQEVVRLHLDEEVVENFYSEPSVLEFCTLIEEKEKKFLELIREWRRDIMQKHQDCSVPKTIIYLVKVFCALVDSTDSKNNQISLFFRNKRVRSHGESFLFHVEELEINALSSKIAKELCICLRKKSLFLLSSINSEIGNLRCEKEYLKRAIQEEVGGSNGSSVFDQAKKLLLLGEAYVEEGSYGAAKEAAYVAQSLIEEYYHVDLPDNRVVLELFNFLSNVERVEGDKRRSKEYLEKATNIARKLLQKGEKEGMDRLLTSLGNNHSFICNIKEAQEFYEKAYEMHKQELGQLLYSDLNTARLLINLTGCYVSSSQLPKAKDTIESAIKILKKCYGDDAKNIDMAKALSAYGDVFYSMVRTGIDKHKINKAQDKLEKSLEMFKVCYGLDYFNHEEVAITLKVLGSLYSMVGKPFEAKKCLELALCKLKLFYDEDHLQLKTVQKGLHELLQKQRKRLSGQFQRGINELKQGNSKEAKKLLKQCHKLYLEFDSSNYDIGIPLIKNLCVSYKRLGKINKAICFSEEILDIRIKKNGSNDSGTLVARQKYKELLLLEEKQKALYQCYEKGQKEFNENNFEKAIEHFQRGIELYPESNKDLQADISFLLVNIASCYKMLNDYKQAVKFYEESWKIRKRIFGVGDEKTVETKELYNEANKFTKDDTTAQPKKRWGFW